MNIACKEFLDKLCQLLEEYDANPETFDQHYDKWIQDNHPNKYPFTGSPLYESMTYIDLGFHVDAAQIKSIIR